MATAAKSLETFYEKDIEKSNFWEVSQIDRYFHFLFIPALFEND